MNSVTLQGLTVSDPEFSSQEISSKWNVPLKRGEHLSKGNESSDWLLNAAGLAC